MTTTIDFRTAVREALDEELAADERVIFFGEDVALAGGVFAVTAGLYEITAKVSDDAITLATDCNGAGGNITDSSVAGTISNGTVMVVVT